MNARLQSRDFGELPDGERVEAWNLCGEGGLQVEVITLGATVRSMLVPDRHGRLIDVVLGFNTLAEYVAEHPYFGATIGRVAGRIRGAVFVHDGKTFPLSRNEGQHHLHGGVRGLNRKLWAATPVHRQDGAPSLRLTASSPDGEEGFPGTLHVEVIYTVLADNTLLLETEAVADCSTPCSLTHHSYFNLAGEGSAPVLDHNLQVHADQYVPADQDLALLGRLQSVQQTGEDLRLPTVAGCALPGLFLRHGSLYKLRGAPERDALVPAARLEHPSSGRVLEVSTTESYLQLYTGASLDGSLQGKSQLRYGPHQGVCLECQGYPDPWNAPGMEDNVLRAGEPRRGRTAYAFSTLPLDNSEIDAAPEGEPLCYAPELPTRKDFRIGILGSGFIVKECHLISYRNAGFHPVALASRTRAHAEAVAARHHIERVYDSYDELLDDASIEVLDIAVPPTQQGALLQAACTRGTVKGILAQKPLALTYAGALEAVRSCEAAGVELSVNQNMRYDPTVFALKQLLERRALGDPVLATINMRGVPHWQPWQADTGSATLRMMSIHHLDCMRFWFGDPARVFCSTRTDPRTPFPHTDGICTTILEYLDGLQCVIIDDVWSGPVREGCPGDLRIEWRVEGLDGLAIGDIGWCKDPYTTPSTMRYARKGDESFHHLQPRQSWFPDAFAGTMAQLLVALERGERPAISGRDNLRTLALVEAAVLSAAEHRMVSVDEITGGPPA